MNDATPVAVIDPETMGGKPCFPGTRVPIQMLFEWLASGHTVEYFVDQLQTVQPDQVRAVLARAADLIRADAAVVTAA